MHDDDLLILEEPLFCCLLPLSLRLSGAGCDRPACGELHQARLSCRVLKRDEIKRELFAVTLAIHLTGTFRGRRVQGFRCVTLQLPFAGPREKIDCRILPGTLTSACLCHEDATECEVCLTVQVCVVDPCPDEQWQRGRKRTKAKRVLKVPPGRKECPECAEILQSCPPLPPHSCR
jgi:hypothetical protein